jgi:aspartate kinase
MGIIVQKYGGTSVGTVEKIKNVAKRVIDKKMQGNSMVVVVSAMGDTTDELIEMANCISSAPDRRELDALLSTGEMVSASLLSMAIKSMEHDAISLSAYQLPISTKGIHGKSLISAIDDKRIVECLKNNQIVIVAGFQGIDEYGDITTLGRGGSDTTAVAIAAKLNGISEIYTDVDGIYTVDPRLYSDAKKLDEISFEEMLELASLGAQVMHSRAVELGEKYNIPIYVAHSSKDIKGTYIKEVKAMESKPITGLAVSDSDVIITLQNLHFSLNCLTNIFESIGEQKISVDMISQTAPINGSISISFTVPREDLDSCKAILYKAIPKSSVKIDEDITKLSVVGIGMKTTSGVAAKLFKILSGNDIQIKMVTTSEIKITCAINQSDKLNAIQIVAREFGL